MNKRIKEGMRRAEPKDEDMGQPSALPMPKAERKTATIMAHIDAELKSKAMKIAKKRGLNVTKAIERGLLYLVSEDDPKTAKTLLELIK